MRWSRLVISRALTLAAAVLFDRLLPDHDAEGVELFQHEWSSPLAAALLTPFTRWDAAHFLSIAQLGYDRDYRLVFFPLFPLLIRGLSAICGLELGMLLALCWNAIAFCLAARTLHEIVSDMGFPALANTAATCFLFNPANVFFATLYSESTYCWLAWTGLHLWNRNPALSCLLLTLASFTRSNGSLNAVIIGWWFVQSCLHSPFRVERTVSRFLRTLAGVLCCISPSFLFNAFAYARLCSSLDRPQLCEEAFPSELPYSYLQRKYWNVGLLRFYEIKQLPNLLLGLPILLYSGCAVLLALQASHTARRVDPIALLQGPAMGWALHLAALMIVVLGWAHVQVSTRLLCSASPLVYVGLAHGLQSPKWRALTAAYLLFFAVAGVCLHCNFLPWT